MDVRLSFGTQQVTNSAPSPAEAINQTVFPTWISDRTRRVLRPRLGDRLTDRLREILGELFGPFGPRKRLASLLRALDLQSVAGRVRVDAVGAFPRLRRDRNEREVR